MKSLLEYKNLMMSVGLIPTIVCMFFCIFFLDATVLYACSLASVGYLLYRVVKPPVYRPNLVLLHGSLSLFIASAIKAIGGDLFIPDRMVPITLELLMLSFSLFYLMAPGFYDKVFSYFHGKVSILNLWATQIIVYLCGIHLLVFLLVYLSFSPLSPTAFYILSHVVPPFIYIICICANYFLVKNVSNTYKKMPFLRIAPVCHGKIYVAPRKFQGEEPGKLDLPLEEYIYAQKTDADKYAREVEKRYNRHLNVATEPRFSLKYRVKQDSHSQRTVLLYVLPLENEDQISFWGGQFVSADDIERYPDKYGSLLREEAIHLDLVAQMWNGSESMKETAF